MTALEEESEMYEVEGCENCYRSDDARALWAVRVLDAAVDGKSAWWECDRLASFWSCGLHADGGRYVQHGEGPAPDAARLAAAQSVWESLPAETRSRLGECP